ncbi:MAG: hypothetical protein K1X79_02205 [Oligoflexia bacterium]|nr:hypothetical protein [Oligoflexia bacterium]
MFKFLTASLFVALISASSAFAATEEVTIQDTSGFTRAASAVDGTGSVEFAVVDASGAAASGAVVTLTNAATGEVLTATAANGLVAFPAVGPGVWTVATTASGITFTSATVATAAAATAAGGLGAAATGAAVVGGGGAAAAVGVASSNNDTPVLSPAT